GDGQSHTIQVQDVDTPDCSAETTLTTTNCAIPCSLSNLQLQVAGGSGGIVHIVEVQDFVFVPANLSLRLGDTVRFVWTGIIPHTTTSDISSGTDSWDSGLLGQGAVYDLVLTSTGIHPYYCVPHGAPGGIGMAGTLEVLPACDNGMVGVGISFEYQGASDSYQVWVDGVRYPGGPFPYNGNPATQTLELTGDGQSHMIQVRDSADDNCFVQGLVALPDCGETPPSPCELSLTTEVIGDCNDQGQVAVNLTLDHQNTGSGYHILLDGIPITQAPLPYGTNSPTSTTINLSGSGTTRTLSIVDQDSTACQASSETMLPDCQVTCLISELAVHSGTTVHTVEVRDFDFSPRDIEVKVGDTVRFVWTGVVPHTTTSDATSGPDSWDSGLLGEGATYDVVIRNEGYHPYYCIPHGGPGGVGMAGSITATEACDNGQAIVDVSFRVSNGSPLGYRVFLDGELIAGPIPYDDPMGLNTTQIGVMGDQSLHTLTVQDMEVDFCAASINFTAPDCPALCLINNLQVRSGSEVVHIIRVEDFVFEPSHLRVRVGETVRFVWTGEVPHTTTSDATSGPDTWASDLLGQGGVYEIRLQKPGLHPYYCVPHGGPGGIGMAGVIEALPACTADSLAHYALSFDITNGSSNGYRVFVGGVPLSGSPYPYDNAMGSNSLDLELPSYGQQLVLTVQDLETPFCAATVSITAADCRPNCSLEASSLGNWVCAAGQASIDVQVVSRAAGADGLYIWVDGQLSGASPYPYTGDTTVLHVSMPNDGFAHTVVVADVAQPDCRDTLQLTPDCPGAECQMEMVSVSLGHNRRHEVLVRDFDFFPRQLDILVGDTVEFVWVGDIPHTATSDTDTGPDSFNSGLLENGASYEVVFTTTGEHPYYCIPHGSPGGVGMAGNITVGDDCDDDMLAVEVQFRVQYPQGDQYNYIINGEPAGSSAYANGSLQQFVLQLPGDGEVYPLLIQDAQNTACRVDTIIKVPDCDDPCYIVNADFSYALTNTPRSYQFTDQSREAPDGRSWSFGDGNTSTALNPVHTYASSGEYTVCLVVENEALNCMDTLCQTIEVRDNFCEANYTYTTDGLSVQFNDESITSSPIMQRTWQFPGGVQIVDRVNPSYTFTAAANYEVCLTIVTEECSATYCDSIDLSDPCLTFEAAFDSQSGRGLEVRFIDQTSGSPNQWLWGFGDGTTSTEQYPVHTYAEDGLYRVCLLVQDTVNNCNDVHCIDQQVGIVDVREPLLSNSLSIFPNPVSRMQSSWSLGGWQEDEIGQTADLRILNGQGQVLQQSSIILRPTTELELRQSLPAGVYLVEARSEKRYYLGRIVVN
ncbi:MAG: PKD domain-containing protein, partial [Bacteroidetes bacterium]